MRDGDNSARIPNGLIAPFHEFSSALKFPVSSIAFFLLAVLVMMLVLAMDRTNATDQQAYLDYFAQGPTWAWAQSLADQGAWVARVVRLFTDEYLWRLWTAVLGSIVQPAAAVLSTVVLLNLLIILTCRKLKHPAVALALWVIAPVGLAVLGVLQIRQGLAFALLMFFAVRLHRPVLGAVVAALVHTTFVPVIVFALLATATLRWRVVAFTVAASAGFLGAMAGSAIFDAFGGRRLAIISSDQGITSMAFVIASLICVLPSIERVLFVKVAEKAAVNEHVIDVLAVIHTGVVAFTVFSAFVFPVGTSRVSYLNWLLLVPMLGSTGGARPSDFATSAASWLCLLYLAGSSFMDGGYESLFPY